MRPNLLDFEKWLEVQADVHEDFGTRTSKCKPPFDTKFKGRNGSTPLVFSIFSPPEGRQGPSGECTRGHPPSVPCVMGDMKYHKLQNCPTFKGLSVPERLERVKEHGLCFRCFGRHWANKCRSTKQCGINGCSKLHNELLHRPASDNGNPTSPPYPSSPPEQQIPTETTAERSNVMLANHKSKVLLQVVPVTLYGPGNQLDTYALLDPGSTCSLVTSDIAGQLGLDGPSESLKLFGIQATSHIETKRVSFDIGPVGVLASRYPVENALVAKRLNLPAVTVDMGKAKSQWRHLAALKLKDMHAVEVKVVLGSDVTEIIIPREVREGPRGSPFGVRTKLGWMVTGNLPGYVRNSESVYFVRVASPEEELNELVKTWWKTESFGCKYDSQEQRSREDEIDLKSLSKTTRKVNGRYEVGLIWKDSIRALPNNRVIAEKRLELLERRLERDSQLKVKYTETVENDLQKGYIKKLEDQELVETDAREWYLPHHAVVHPHKPGKVRRVSDAAARAKGSP